MTWNITDRFPDWGETGESPPTGFFYEGGDQVNEKHLDYLWNSVKGLEDDVQTALDDIDNDSDGKVDSAETADTATLVKGKDIDSNGDGIVDQADSVTNPYTDNDAIAAVDGEVDNAATTVASLDDVVADKADKSTIWEGQEVSGSPFNITGDFEVTVNLSDSYDVLYVRYEVFEQSGSSQLFSLQFNGNTNTVYDTLRYDSTTTTQQSTIKEVAGLDANESGIGEFMVTNSEDSFMFRNISPIDTRTNGFDKANLGYANIPATGITQFTMLGVSSMELIAEVYGINNGI